MLILNKMLDEMKGFLIATNCDYLISNNDLPCTLTSTQLGDEEVLLGQGNNNYN